MGLLFYLHGNILATWSLSQPLLPAFLFKMMSGYVGGHWAYPVSRQLGRLRVFATNVFASSGLRAIVLLQLGHLPLVFTVVPVVGAVSHSLAQFPDLGCSHLHPPSGCGGSKDGTLSLSLGPWD